MQNCQRNRSSSVPFTVSWRSSHKQIIIPWNDSSFILSSNEFNFFICRETVVLNTAWKLSKVLNTFSVSVGIVLLVWK